MRRLRTSAASRRYFRVDDEVLIKYRVIDDSELERERRLLYLNQIRVENAQAALLGIDTRLQEAIAAIRYEQPLVAEVVDLLNRKLGLIERLVAFEGPGIGSDGIAEHAPTAVSLSGGGLAITADSPLPVDACLAIDLVLLPAHEPLCLLARVVGCDDAGREGYRIAVEYDDIRHHDRDLLVQHVTRKQGRALQANRRGAGPGKAG